MSTRRGCHTLQTLSWNTDAPWGLVTAPTSNWNWAGVHVVLFPKFKEMTVLGKESRVRREGWEGERPKPSPP